MTEPDAITGALPPALRPLHDRLLPVLVRLVVESQRRRLRVHQVDGLKIAGEVHPAREAAVTRTLTLGAHTVTCEEVRTGDLRHSAGSVDLVCHVLRDSESGTGHPGQAVVWVQNLDGPPDTPPLGPPVVPLRALDAFLAEAVDPSGRSTLHPARHADLGARQRRLLTGPPGHRAIVRRTAGLETLVRTLEQKLDGGTALRLTQEAARLRETLRTVRSELETLANRCRVQAADEEQATQRIGAVAHGAILNCAANLRVREAASWQDAMERLPRAIQTILKRHPLRPRLALRQILQEMESTQTELTARSATDFAALRAELAEALVASLQSAAPADTPHPVLHDRMHALAACVQALPPVELHDAPSLQWVPAGPLAALLLGLLLPGGCALLGAVALSLAGPEHTADWLTALRALLPGSVSGTVPEHAAWPLQALTGALAGAVLSVVPGLLVAWHTAHTRSARLHRLVDVECSAWAARRTELGTGLAHGLAHTLRAQLDAVLQSARGVRSHTLTAAAARLEQAAAGLPRGSMPPRDPPVP